MHNPQKASSNFTRLPRCRAVVIWIDWYAYHLARFQGLQSTFGYEGEITGIEMVGGVGVHTGLRFREELPVDLPVQTLLPQSNWGEASKIGLAYALWRRLSHLDPDVVLVPGYYTLPALAAAVWARVHGRASVLMTESTADDHTRVAWREILKSFVIRTLFSWAVTGGVAHVRYLLQLGFPNDRIARFYDVVDNDGLRQRCTEFRQHSAAIDYGLPPRYFLFVGRLAPEKNVVGLVRAWLAYRESGGSWPLVLAGDGPDAEMLRNLAAKSPFAADVYFTGHKSSSDLLPYFSFADCFVLPSTREPWGLVVNEAMAASLPVIVSTRCGCAEDLVINGRNGLLFDPLHDGGLTDCLHAIERLPAEDLSRMGAHSADHVASYSPQNFGREIAAIANRETLLHPRTVRHTVTPRVGSSFSLSKASVSATHDESNSERIA